MYAIRSYYVLFTESISAILVLILFFISMFFRSYFQRKKLYIPTLVTLVSIFTLTIVIFPTDFIRKTRNIEAISSIERRQELITIGFREIPHYLWGTGLSQQITIYSPQDKARLGFGFLQLV